jgi:hypothetical protein
MSDSIQNELLCNKDSILHLFVGKQIGSGASRRVYELNHREDAVIKVEYTGRTFHNQTEWAIWQSVKDTALSDWFVKCLDIDSVGNVLLQAKTKPFECNADFREALRRTRGGVLPKFFDDIHYGNFGLYNDRVACHDYGYHKFFENAFHDSLVELGFIEYDKPDEDANYISKEKQFALNI